MKVFFFLGTAAELIKVYPLMVEFEKKKIPWLILQSGQSFKNFWPQASDFKISTDKILKISPFNENFKTFSDALVWFIHSLSINLINFKMKISSQKDRGVNYLFVHGDTLSTLVGAIYGKIFGFKVVHIEAGLRTGNIFNPFPEEISRRLVSKLSSIHFAQDQTATNNLKSEKIIKNVYPLQGNIIADTIKLQTSNLSAMDKGHVLINIHRHENLNFKKNWDIIISLVRKISSQHKVIFIMMPNTEKKLEMSQGLKKSLEKIGVEFKTRLLFRDFIQLLATSKFVVTDSGTNQEECYYLGKACLVMRDFSERNEGVGKNCIISRFQEDKIFDFLNRYQDFNSPTNYPQIGPSQIVIGHILK